LRIRGEKLDQATAAMRANLQRLADIGVVTRAQGDGALGRVQASPACGALLRADAFPILPHGCWLNMAEAEIALLRRQALDQRLPDTDAVRRALGVWERSRNGARATVSWRFTVEDARRKLKAATPPDRRSAPTGRAPQ
jgi:hypothetical protein